MTLGRRSLSLPQSFVLDHSGDGLVGFVDDGPDLPSCRIVYKRTAARDFVGDPEETKQLRTFRISGIQVVEYAPKTESGRAKAGLRFYLLELTANSSIMVLDGQDKHARQLAEQWGK